MRIHKQIEKNKDSVSLDAPATASWKIKGAGIAYTTAGELLSSQAGKKAIEDANKIVLVK